MRLTHLGHACLLVESGGVRVLVDPGVFSAAADGVTGLDAILVTHQHADHIDPERLASLAVANPDAVLLMEPQTAAVLADRPGPALPVTPISGGQTRALGGLLVEGVGSEHALIHEGVPRPGNTGFVLSAEGEPTLFHPGDAYDALPGRPVDVLAVPLNAPWTAVRDTLAFVRRLAPRWVVPIHDALLSEVGRTGYLMHVETFAPPGASLRDLVDGRPWTVDDGDTARR